MGYVQQLLKGLIDPIVLSTINRLPMYGYQLVKELERKTAGRFKFKGGTIYPALLRLEKEGLVTSKWRQITRGRGRRYYQITEKGRQFLSSRSAEWHDFYLTVNGLIERANTSD